MLKYQISILQINSYRPCAKTAASCPFLLLFFSHSCANAVVCGTTPWRISGNLIYQMSSCVLPKKYTEWLLGGTELRFTAWGHEHVCQHTWGSRCAIPWQEMIDAAIFSEYCCQTWKLAHNYRLSSIAFLYFITNHSSFSRSPTQTVICLLFRS